MKFLSIRKYLKPYSIHRQRRTTIAHAFASAIAEYDVYDEAIVRQAISHLGQDPDGELVCVYCGADAETWDHLYPLVRSSRHSGYGHRIGNLVPCCGPCNQHKRNADWETWLRGKAFADTESKIATIRSYHDRFYSKAGAPNAETEEYRDLLAEILRLMARADEIAEKIRARE